MSAMLPFSAVLAAPNLRQVADRNVEAFRRAVVTKDAAWFDRTFAPGFVQHVNGKPLDRRTSLAQIRKGLLRMQLAGLRTTVVKVVPLKTGLVATVEFVGTAKGAVQGVPATLTAKWTDDQTWLRSGTSWKLARLSTHGFTRSVLLNR